MKVDAETKALIKLLDDEFREKGYKFSLAYESKGEAFDKLNVAALSRGPTLLRCEGTENEDAALHVYDEIQRLLGADVIQRYNTLFELKDRNYYISGKTLSSRVKQEGDQSGDVKPATSPDLKSKVGRKPISAGE